MAVCALIMHKIAFQADNGWAERIGVQIVTVAVVFAGIWSCRPFRR